MINDVGPNSKKFEGKKVVKGWEWRIDFTLHQVYYDLICKLKLNYMSNEHLNTGTIRKPDKFVSGFQIVKKDGWLFENWTKCTVFNSLA